MQHAYTSKASLYQCIAQMRRLYGISLGAYPIDTISLARTRAKVTIHPFDASGLYGMAIPGPKQDSIALSSYRTLPERRFDCGHEMVHLFKHRDVASGGFTCYSSEHPSQDPILEWEANAGSAELIVPYRLFLKEVKENEADCTTENGYRKFRLYLAQRFGTTVPVISLRFEDLKYELHQYLSGTPLDEIEIVSHRAQRLRNIDIPSLNQQFHVDPSGITHPLFIEPAGRARKPC